MIEETRDKIVARLDSWGIETPILTKDQKQELRNLVLAMIEDGASRGEIRDEVVAKLNEWSIETPILTENQKQKLRNLVRAMMEETRGKIDEKLSEWCIRVPRRLIMCRRIVRRRLRRVRWTLLPNHR
jgi:hypothetical protein